MSSIRACFQRIQSEVETSQVLLLSDRDSVPHAHHVSSKGIHPSKENVHAIKEFPMPETYTQVRVFCGLAGHYHCFIKGFAHVWYMPCMIYWVTRLRWDQ